MIPCQKCACDLFEIAVQDGVCWLACFNCHALKREAAIPIGMRFADVERGRNIFPRTGLELHRMTNADGLNERRGVALF